MPILRQRVAPPPRYRRHKASGQAVVTLNGRDHYLGTWGSRLSQQNYDQLVAEWLANGRQATSSNALTVVEITAAYWQFAKSYYVKNGQPSGFLATIRVALRTVKSKYGHCLAIDFGPLALRSIQNQLAEQGLARTYVNKLVDVIRRMFKWAVSREMIPPTVHQALATVPGLRRGRSAAAERPRVLPIGEDVVTATLPWVPPTIAAMIQFQRLTGARPTEVCLVRPCDVDRSGEVWRYRPESHKTEHHDRARVIFIGPRAQELLKPFLQRDPSVYCFVPAESERARHTVQRAARATPLTPSQVQRYRKAMPNRPPGARYEVNSYRRAIHRACDCAWPVPRGLDQEQIRAWRKVHRWSPNRLRHSAATEIRRRFGLEAAQVALGHASADVSQIYAERDYALAAQVMALLG